MAIRLCSAYQDENQVHHVESAAALQSAHECLSTLIVGQNCVFEQPPQRTDMVPFSERAEHVPGPYRHFMQAPDSVLKDYYPLDFKTDRNGKVQEWKSVVLLSHIDPRRLQETLQPIWENRKLWSDIERMRNRPDVARIYVCDQGPTKNMFQKLFRMQNDPRLADAKVSSEPSRCIHTITELALAFLDIHSL